MLLHDICCFSRNQIELKLNMTDFEEGDKQKFKQKPQKPQPFPRYFTTKGLQIQIKIIQRKWKYSFVSHLKLSSLSTKNFGNLILIREFGRLHHFRGVLTWLSIRKSTSRRESGKNIFILQYYFHVTLIITTILSAYHILFTIPVTSWNSIIYLCRPLFHFHLLPLFSDLTCTVEKVSI